MDVYLVDGTYELFRHFYALPSHLNTLGEEVAAVRGVLGTIAGLLESGATHIGVATDHVIESFRNDLWPGYKTGEGVDPRLLSQFWPLEESLQSMGILVWPMVELEADDAIAAAAASLARFKEIDRIYICSPDKDFGQCVVGTRIVQLNRRDNSIRDAQGVHDKFGVGPESIPDFLALVGDTADGYPGLTGWGEKSASTVLAAYHHLEQIPKSPQDWKVTVRGSSRLARTLQEEFKLAMLFRDLATLRTDKPRLTSTDDLRWTSPKPSFQATLDRLEAPSLSERLGSIMRS